VDILFTACMCVTVCVCVCTVTDFSAEDRAIAASNFARWFIDVLGRESSIFGDFNCSIRSPKNGQIGHHSKVLPRVYILTLS